MCRWDSKQAARWRTGLATRKGSEWDPIKILLSKSTNSAYVPIAMPRNSHKWTWAITTKSPRSRSLNGPANPMDDLWKAKETHRSKTKAITEERERSKDFQTPGSSRLRAGSSGRPAEAAGSLLPDLPVLTGWPASISRWPGRAQKIAHMRKKIQNSIK
jgi:hypothetical protein